MLLSRCGFVDAQEHESRLPEVTAKAYFDLGAAYMVKKRFDLAESKLELSLRDLPTPEALNALAVLYESQHDNVLAENTYKKLIKDFPDYIMGYSNYYIFLCKYDRKNQIITLNNIMISRREKFAGIGFIEAGNCAITRDRVAKAKEYYKQALAYDPYVAGALLPLAKIDHDRGFVEEAKRKVDLVNNQIGYSARPVYLSVLTSRELGN